MFVWALYYFSSSCIKYIEQEAEDLGNAEESSVVMFLMQYFNELSSDGATLSIDKFNEFLMNLYPDMDLPEAQNIWREA